MRITRNNCALSRKNKTSLTVDRTVGTSSSSVKRQSERLRKIPVKVSEVPQKNFTPPDLTYDKEGNDMTLFNEQPVEGIMSNTAIQSCKFMLRKSKDLRRELETTLDRKLKLNSNTTLRYLAGLIAMDRNMLQSIHHLLMAESYRLTVVKPVGLGSQVQTHDQCTARWATLPADTDQKGC